ncbi:MAG: ABC transporter ATP-binding protein [Candidatus Hodarchaeales archaeon]
MSVNEQNSQRVSLNQTEIGILLFIALTAIEFASNFGLIPLLNGLAINSFEIAAMLSNFLILGFVLGILGFLTYSRESLLAGTLSSATELIVSLLILIQIALGRVDSGFLLQAVGVTTLALVACYVSFSTVFFKEKIATVHEQVQERSSHVVLEIQDLTKHYDLGPIVVKALDGLSFTIRRGDMVAIMGPSGSGKSTLLNQLGLLDSPTSGKIILDGQDVSKMDQLSLSYERNSKIGFIFQSYNLLSRSSVLKNVELPSIVNFSMKKSERSSRGLKFLRMLGLDDEIYRTPKTLSGGQQQRVAIARSLMNDPSIILADEPTGNLDSKSGGVVMDVLKKLNEESGITVILVTHDREVANFADRIIFLRDGKIASEKVLPKEIMIQNGDK